MKFIRSDEISYIKPSIESFLGEYNTALASILSENAGNLAYIASPVINRMEAQTHFFEYIEKYIQIRNLLLKDNDSGVLLTKDDTFLYGQLNGEFNGRVRKETVRSGKITHSIKRYFKEIHLLVFIYRAFSFLSKTFILIWASRRTRRPSKKYASIMTGYFDFRCKGSDGALREEYFGPFAVDLARHENLLVVFRMIHLKDISAFIKLSDEQKNFDSCLKELFLTPLEAINSLVKFAAGKIKLTKKCFYKNTDITALLQKMIDINFYTLHGIDVFTEYEIAKKVLGLMPDKFYMPYENQTWEKVYPLLNKKTTGVKTHITGFQHTGLSYKLLQHFPAQAEAMLPFYPDRILTVGKIYQRLLKEKAHFPCQIFEGAALRHAKYMTNGAINVKMPHKALQGRIAYAFSYDTSKYAKIINLLKNVFGDGKLTIYLKMHPDYDENVVLRSLRIRLPDNFVLAQKMPWSEVFDSVDCVLYDDNSIGMEGMINGVKTFMLDSGEPIYDCGRMYYFNGGNTSIGANELKQLKTDLENSTFDPSYDINKAKEYIYSYYTPYVKEKHFLLYLNPGGDYENVTERKD